jgi:type III secretory pathway lipoprotein EscJ
MRSFNGLSPISALGRIYPWVEQVRRSALVQRRSIRWGLAAIAVSTLLLLGYLRTASLSTVESSFLSSGRRFSPDDLIKVCRALDRKQIDYRIDDQRRVVVTGEQFDSAAAVIAKLELGPRSLDELRDQAISSSVWESIHDKEIRENQRQEKIVESLINKLPGIVGSFVLINRPKERWGLHATAKPSTFVSLETEEDRQLPFRTIQSITRNLTGSVPGLAPEAITVVDRRGHVYLEAGNPALSALSDSRAREEQVSQEILEKLEWIKGVRVSVQLPGATAADPELSTARPLKDLHRSDHKPEPTTTKTSPPQAQPQPAPLPPAAAINRPLTLDPEPAPAPPSPALDAPSAISTTEVGSMSSPGSRASAETIATSRDGPIEQGRVWVKVPRSYYLNASNLPGHKEPSQEDLRRLVARTEEQIRTGIALIVPLSGPGAWKTIIDMIPDEGPLNRPPIVSSPAESRRVALDWGIAAAMGAIAAALVTLGSWALSGRRPAGRLEPAPAGLRSHRGTVATAGPSERVREFVRRNPESAVSVLERWTSQGADHS